ncbi:MAG: hypothetical protein ABSA06_08135 [Geobacteraceae bacterium]
MNAWMSVDGIQIWVEGVARAAPAAATTNIIASEKIFTMFFITHSFVN